MDTNSLDLQDFLDATSDAAKRTRLATIVLVVVCVLGFVGFLNSIQAGWMIERLQKAGDPNNPYVAQKLGFVPDKTDDRYINFHSSLARAYVENALTVRVPFFGVAFDINDLSLLSGIAFITVLLMLRYSLRNEIVSLRLAFKAAIEAGKNNPKQLDTFYDLLAMRMVLTLPNLEDENVVDKASRDEFLKIVPNLICFLAPLVYGLIIFQDYRTLDIGNILSQVRTQWLIAYTVIFWHCILALSIWCFLKLRKIDKIWKEYWKVNYSSNSGISPANTKNS
jgi:hypothetical protein